jgi:demethylmenaquinone methyltransferase/2-methoxy-6-polyprenyl-1,4-benzoquinol methylase
MPNDPTLVDYYARRAREYERLYEKPERQGDLRVLKELCAQTLAGHTVLEIACGTGFWTQAAAQTAQAITATDINREMLQLAEAKPYPCPVAFRQVDAFRLEELPAGDFTAGMAMAWWSHLRPSELQRFLAGYHRRLQPGALLLFMDNRFVAGSNSPISRTDEEGNTYQWRKLADGSRHEVLKNFPSEAAVREVLAGVATDIRWTELPYYWLLTYRLPA